MLFSACQRENEFIVRVVISAVTDFAGYDFYINYNPNVVHIVTPKPGGSAGSLWVYDRTGR